MRSAITTPRTAQDARSSLRRTLPPALRGALLRALAFAIAATAVVAAMAGSTAPAWAQAPERYAGTYRIADWRALEGRGLYHFFYLHPDGRFLLQAAWPGHERSRFAGTWSVTGDRLYLNGQGNVDTSQGDWRVEFQRTFRIRVAQAGFRLEPEPLKNRYGLLGWPSAFLFHRPQPAPNLPDEELPSDAAAMGELIAKVLAANRNN
jgi:hypothetical protein